jgi:hypothetical protein
MESADTAGRQALLAVAHAYEVLAKYSEPKITGPLAEQLAEQARQRAELGERHIVKQRKIVAELKRDGHDTYAAERLLRTFEETQVLHKEHADRLSRDAAAAKRKPRARR